MSEERQFNDLVKRMLDFGHKNEVPPSTSEKDTSIVLQNGKVNDITLPPLATKETPLPRKERRAQDRVAKRLEKLKKANIKKEDLTAEVKSRLQKAKEEVRKSQFSDDDKERIERILFNKTK